MKNGSRSAEACTPAVSRRAALPGAALAGAALAQGRFPAHPPDAAVRAPWTAGSSSDVQMRSLAELAQQALGQSPIIENRPGARGTLHAQPMAAARPDGHTLLRDTLATLAVNPALCRDLPFDTAASFGPVVFAAIAPNVPVANPRTTEARSVQELIALGRRRPRGLP